MLLLLPRTAFVGIPDSRLRHAFYFYSHSCEISRSDISSLHIEPLEALAGDNYDVEGQTNLFVEAWMIDQIREGNVPAVGAVVNSK
ncbi:MAG: hypothetical protein LBG28_14895 [Tannerella sp.]|nr:hypothetical protein [Tannerella sp.]